MDSLTTGTSALLGVASGTDPPMMDDAVEVAGSTGVKLDREISNLSLASTAVDGFLWRAICASSKSEMILSDVISEEWKSDWDMDPPTSV
jgi:hypothetical protein